MIGYGHEFMDIDNEPDAHTEYQPAPAVATSDRGAGPLGFTGTAAKTDSARAAGLTTFTDDPFGDSPTAPMLPGTWCADPNAPE